MVVTVDFHALPAIKRLLKQLRIVSAAFVQNVRILIRYHCRLRMTGIPLHRLNIAAIQLEFAVLLCGQKLLAPCVANMILYGIYTISKFTCAICSRLFRACVRSFHLA